MAVVGCYSLDLYCDTGGEPYGDKCPHNRPGAGTYPHQFTGQIEGECMRAARRIGWKFNRDRSKAYCPACNRRPQGRNER